jgi:hypothetical protein
MRSFVVASLTVLMLVCGANASAGGWRDLRIDASSDSSFSESAQQMRDELPYNRAVLFVLILQDLEMRLTPTEYRAQLDGLSYKQIVHLASPSVFQRQLMYYAQLHNGDAAAGSAASMSAASSGGFSGSPPNPFGAYPGFNQMTGQRLLAQ